MGYSVLVEFDEEAIQRRGYGVAEARRIATDRPDLLRLRSAQALDRQKQVARDDNQPVANLPKFDSPKALLVWLYKVAKNRCLMSRACRTSAADGLDRERADELRKKVLSEYKEMAAKNLVR
jgi:hypothetical protein